MKPGRGLTSLPSFLMEKGDYKGLFKGEENE